MAARASVRTTQLYDRRRDDVTLDEVVDRTAGGATNFEEVNLVRLLVQSKLAVSLTAAWR
jgi:hypothetical protein